MSERDANEGRRGRDRSRSRSRDRERDRHSERLASSRKRSRDRRPHSSSRSRSRSHSPHNHHRRSHHRHERDDRERHSRYKKHKRHKDDRGSRSRKHSSSRRRSHSPSVSSASPSPSRTPSPPPAAAAAAAAVSSSFPSPSSLEAARSTLSSLLALDPASHDDLLFLIFQLDHRRSINIPHVADTQASEYLRRLVQLLGLQKIEEESGEEGWRAWEEWGDRKLLPELETVFDAARQADKKRQTDEEETKAERVSVADPHKPNQNSHPAVLIGPALPPPSYRPSATAQQQQQPEVADEQSVSEEEDESDAGYGPRLASQLTPEETAALAQLQHARKHLTHTKQHIHTLRTTTTATTTPSSHEEWMVVPPPALSTSAALVASMTGDRAMQGRVFAMRGGGSSGGGGGRDIWVAGPEEREWKRVEREAERGVEKALAHLRAVQQRLYNKPTSARTDASAARPSVAPASSNEPSLLDLHQQRLNAEKSGGVRERGAPILWDREKEMGMRRHKTNQQIAGELRGANDLSSRFAMSSG